MPYQGQIKKTCLCQLSDFVQRTEHNFSYQTTCSRGNLYTTNAYLAIHPRPHCESLHSAVVVFKGAQKRRKPRKGQGRNAPTPKIDSWLKPSCLFSVCKVIVVLLVGFIIYRVRIRRGGRKRPAPKGQVYGKPKSVGINQLKNQRSLQAVAEVF